MQNFCRKRLGAFAHACTLVRVLSISRYNVRWQQYKVRRAHSVQTLLRAVFVAAGDLFLVLYVRMCAISACQHTLTHSVREFKYLCESTALRSVRARVVQIMRIVCA